MQLDLRVPTRHEFSKLRDDLGATMIYSMHDQVEAMDSECPT